MTNITCCDNCRWFKRKEHTINGYVFDGLCTYYGSNYSKQARRNICDDYENKEI